MKRASFKVVEREKGKAEKVSNWYQLVPFGRRKHVERDSSNLIGSLVHWFIGV